jgi:large subunit ribosomal protein L30
MLKIELKRSYIGLPEKQRKVLRALGLRKIGASVTKPDDPIFRGMIHKVSHLIKVTEE